MFDPLFYKYLNPELDAESDADLLNHFNTVGWQENLDPCALFNVRAYLDTHKDVADAKCNPLEHFVEVGQQEGRQSYLSYWGSKHRSPVPLSEFNLITGKIDAEFIRSQVPAMEGFSDEALTAWYLAVGWHEGIDPTKDFSGATYVLEHHDVEDAGINPFLHFIKFGEAEGRTIRNSDAFAEKPSLRLSDRQAQLVREMDAVRHHFDADYYRETYPDVTGSDEALLRHFLVTGWKEGRDPSATFSTDVYLDLYHDIARSGTNPLIHYAIFGQGEGRLTAKPQERPPEIDKALQADMNAVRQLFDAEWYGRTYSDLREAEIDLLEHFMVFGWREGRDPSPNFSTSYYLQSYPDIAQNNVNPLLHYALFGKSEGRRPSAGTAIALFKSKSAVLTPDLPDTGKPVFAGTAARKPRRLNPDALNIHWIIPDFRAGSGGHMTIFRMVRFLESFGHKNTIWIEKPNFHDTPHEAWENIVKYFQCVEADVRFVTEEIYTTSGDVMIATGWDTAWRVQHLKGFAAKMYFVQDHEPEFYATGALSNLARETYGFDLGCICASPWLEQLMTEQYGRWARGFYLAFEPQQYSVMPELRTPGGPLKIAVYARSHTDRRCVQLALGALQILAGERDDFEVHLYGQDDLPFTEAPFTAYNHGILSPEKLAELYNSCDIGICFSGTNYSLVPQEMMACGLPLIELDTQSTRIIFPSNVVTLAGPAPADIAKKLSKLLDDDLKRDKQRAAALKWVNRFSWKKSAQQVEQAILAYLEHRDITLSAPAIGTARKDILLDVVVPTWNGKEEFKPVLEALRGQSIADQVQIYCVDSTSSDGTIKWLGNQKDVSLTVIDQSEFQHGRTRNFGASLGTAPFISFITQDAMPATPDWAGDIVKMMRAVPDAAGLFGRHIAYPDHPTFVREEIQTHFENMLKHPLVLSKHTDPEKWASGDVGWRQLLHFYSDNNSAMRRDIWNDIPYPEVDYGEDQVWARDIIEAGYSKIYAPTATVFHSHDYDPEQTYKRSKTEGAFFYEHFGYELGLGSDAEIAQRIEREQAGLDVWGARKAVSADEIAMRKANIAEKYRGWRDGRESAMARYNG